MKRVRIAACALTLVVITVSLDAQPVPQMRRTQQQVLTEIIARHLELGRMIPPDTFRHTEALRRAQAGQIIAVWAITLSDDRAFEVQVRQCCAALREQWPWLVEDCLPCRK